MMATLGIAIDRLGSPRCKGFAALLPLDCLRRVCRATRATPGCAPSTVEHRVHNRCCRGVSLCPVSTSSDAAPRGVDDTSPRKKRDARWSRPGTWSSRSCLLKPQSVSPVCEPWRRRCSSRRRRHRTCRRRISTRCCAASTVCVPNKTATMQVSKAYRCQLPALRNDQLDHLRRWAAHNCAQAALFRDESDRVVLMALRDRPRSAASHSRTMRTTLRTLAIEGVHLRGKWLHLVTACEVLAVGAVDSAQRCTAVGLDARAADDVVEAGDDVRVVPLR
jgi:hypothetical protein